MRPQDLARAEAFGRLAARDELGIGACPYEANGDRAQRILAGRFVRAYVNAGGRVSTGEDDMPEGQIAARGGAVRWRTVKLPSGKTVRVAVVRKAGPRGGHTVAGPVHNAKGK